MFQQPQISFITPLTTLGKEEMTNKCHSFYCFIIKCINIVDIFTIDYALNFLSKRCQFFVITIKRVQNLSLCAVASSKN